MELKSIISLSCGDLRLEATVCQEEIQTFGFFPLKKSGREMKKRGVYSRMGRES